MPISVRDASLADVLHTAYDIVLFCSGYEERCTFVPRVCHGVRYSEAVVLGFAKLSNSGQRQANDKYFVDVWRRRPELLSADDDSRIYEILQRATRRKKQLKVLVDYSSMSRIWYAAILNWARFALSSRSISVDFVYSIGKYDAVPAPIVIDDMLAIPGCDGGALGFSRFIAVFGLGFYGQMAQCVFENLQPDRVLAFLAEPGGSPEYASMVRNYNSFLIDQADALVDVPLRSVSSAVRMLSELVIPERADGKVVLIPMGPKPHVLSSIIVSMRMRDVACLRVSAIRERPEAVPASGDVVVSRVTLEPERNVAQTAPDD